ADRRARMADAECVVLAFGARRKRREAAVLLDGVQPVASAGEHLVRIRLMADVPHEAVVRRVEDVMERNRQLYRAEARGEVAAARADGLDEELPQLLRDRREFGRWEAAQVRRRVDRAQQRVTLVFGHGPQVYRNRAGRTLTGPAHHVPGELGERCGPFAERGQG